MKNSIVPLFFLISIQCFSQLNNRSFEQRMLVTEADSNKLFFGLNFLGFAKNNEYSHTTINGYTLFGYQLNPYLSFHLAKNVRLDAGVYVQKDFGNNRYTEIAPTLSLKIVKQNFNFIFGTLEGRLSHRLIEPLYDFESGLNQQLENGIQILWMKDDLFLDVWADWQKMIYFNDPEPERFAVGLSFNKTIWRSGAFHIDLPIQFLADHVGGQIDVNGNPVITRYNGAIGLTLETESEGSIRAWGVQTYVVGYRSSSDQNFFKDGHGVFISPYLKTNIGVTVMGSYWLGDQFLTIQGNQLYPSVPENYPGRVDEVREFFMLRVLYDLKLAEGLMLTARAEPFYDTYANDFDYSFGFYLNFKERFFLMNAKKSK